MKMQKRILILIMIVVMMITLSGPSIQSSANIVPGNPVKVAVLLYSFDITYINQIRKSLEDIQKVNNGNVKFTFFDGRANQAIQNETINSMIGADFDLMLVDLVNINADTIELVINTAKQKKIPVILFPIEPLETNLIKSYDKAIVIATDVKQSGILEGKIVIDAWNKDKEDIDKNKDNILQYVMLTATLTDTVSVGRMKYSISTINSAGIKTEQLAVQVAYFDRELAKGAIESLFLKYGEKIEAIISTTDPMAIGAIEGLQKYGYNSGDKTKFIPVVGVDAAPESVDLIKKGFMTGTVDIDPPAMAQALYTVGMNLVYNKNPLDGTDYKFNETGVVIQIPRREYISNEKKQ